MMKKLWLTLLVCLMLAAGCLAVGCKKQTEQLAAEIPKDTTVEIGMPYTVENVVGTYGGENVTAEISVTFGGETVNLESSAFTADKLGEYTVTYTFRYGKDSVSQYTQKITCVDTTAPTVVLGEDASIAYKVHAGDKLCVSEDMFSVKDRSGETLKASVAVYAGTEENEDNRVTVAEDGTFEASAQEGYLVVASATDSSGNTGRYTQQITLFEEGELEYFNNRDYAETQILLGANGGGVEYIEDREYVFEGSGAVKFTFNGGGWPAFGFNGLRKSDFDNCTELSFWVYNPTDYVYSFTLVSCGLENGKVKEIAHLTQQIAVPCGRWIRVSVAGDAIRAELAKEEVYTLGIYSSKNWLPGAGSDEGTNAAYRESFALCFDAFKIVTQSASYKISAEDMEVNLDVQSGETLLLSASDLKDITDYGSVSAQVTDADGKTIAVLTATENGISYSFEEEGKYTVYYLYRDGADGCTAEQSILVYSDATVQNYRDDYGLVDFDNLSPLKSEEFSVGNDTATVSKAVMDGNNVLKFESMSSSAFSNLQIEAPVLSQLCAGDTLRFRMYLDTYNANGTSYNLRVKKTNPETLIYGLDTINTGEWITVTVTDADAISSIIENKLIWIAIECIGATNYNYILYIDDIEVVKPGSLAIDNGQSVEDAVGGLFVSGTQLEIVIKDEEGQVCTPGESGEIATVGKYTVTATASAEGFNAREYTFALTVADKDKLIFSVPDDATVEIKTDFVIETVTGTYKDEPVSPVITVTYGGEPVQSEGGKFTANKLGDYIITYDFSYGDGQTASFTRTVTCVDTTKPQIVVEGIADIVSAGESVSLSDAFAATDNSGESIAVTFKVYKETAGGEEVVLSGGIFTAESGVSKYVVVASASDSSGNEASLSCTIFVLQDGEFTWLNDEEFVSNMLIVGSNGGGLEYNTNPEYIFEGTGSIKFTFGNSGWPKVVFTNTDAAYFEDCTEFSFWVYNPTSVEYKFRVMMTNAKGESEKGLNGGGDEFTVAPHRWTNIRISGEKIRASFEQWASGGYDKLCIFASRDWYSDFSSYVLYFDSFSVLTEASSFSIQAGQVSGYLNDQQGGTVLLTSENVTGLDIADVTAQIFDESGALVADVAASGNSISYLFEKEGSYTVYYLYKNGADGCTATQNVIIYENIEVYRDDYGLVDFDNLSPLKSEEFSVGNDTATVSKAVMDGNNVLKFESGTWSAFASLQIESPVLSQLCEGDALRFKLYLDPNASDATSFNLRVKKAKPETVLYGLDTLETGKWITVTITDASAISTIIKDQLVWIMIESIGASNNYNYIFYIDDIEVVKNMNIEVGANVASALAAIFPNATVGEDITVTDSSQETYELVEGAFAESGTYTLSVTVSADGFNARRIDVNVTVSDAS